MKGLLTRPGSLDMERRRQHESTSLLDTDYETQFMFTSQPGVVEAAIW